VDKLGIMVQFPEGARDFFFFSKIIQTGSGVHPPSYVVGTGPLSLGVRQLDHEADHSLPSSAEVTNERSYTATAPALSWHAQGQLYLLTL
jgi:hypothetical protein